MNIIFSSSQSKYRKSFITDQFRNFEFWSNFKDCVSLWKKEIILFFSIHIYFFILSILCSLLNRQTEKKKNDRFILFKSKKKTKVFSQQNYKKKSLTKNPDERIRNVGCFCVSADTRNIRKLCISCFVA